MRKINVTLSAQTLLQLSEGTHEAVRDGGDLYVLLSREDAAPGGGQQAPPPPPKKSAPKQPVVEPTAKGEMPEPEAENTDNSVESSAWTEEMMKEMLTEDLLAEVESLGIDPNATPGRNTGKKLRQLILDHWSGNSDVADDTSDAAEEESGYTEIPQSEWSKLEEGTMVLAKLKMEEGAEDADKLWEAEVVGLRKPRGGTKKELYVFFTEDEEEDHLRDGDVLYEYTAGVV